MQLDDFVRLDLAQGGKCASAKGVHWKGPRSMIGSFITVSPEHRCRFLKFAAATEAALAFGRALRAGVTRS